MAKETFQADGVDCPGSDSLIEFLSRSKQSSMLLQGASAARVEIHVYTGDDVPVVPKKQVTPKSKAKPAKGKAKAAPAKKKAAATSGAKKAGGKKKAATKKRSR